jgi:RNA polymerase sigma-70 factor (ECF subfamily)
MIATHQTHPFVPPPSDADLLHAASNGDVEAFRRLFERHVDAIRGYLTARLGPDAADDVLVETFTAAWSSRARFRLDANSARPWLYGIATIHAKRHHAAEARWQLAAQAERQAADAERSPAPPIPGCSRKLADAIASLSQSEREILLLVALGDMTVAMAARAAGISSVAARMRLHRARRHVAGVLGSKGEETNE